MSLLFTSWNIPMVIDKDLANNIGLFVLMILIIKTVKDHC